MARVEIETVCPEVRSGGQEVLYVLLSNEGMHAAELKSMILPIRYLSDPHA